MTATLPSEPQTRELAAGLRVYPRLRTAHVEEIDAASPRRTLYFSTNYDLDVTRVPAHMERTSLLQAARVVLGSPEPVLELHEPLWIEALPEWLVIAAAWRAGGFRRRRRGVVFFAIENNDLRDVLSNGRRSLRPFTPVIRTALRVLVPLLAERCAFGTPGAAATYGPILGRRRPRTSEVLDLLRAKVEPDVVKHSLSATFVGALEERKGVVPLLASWPEVERALPGATLTLIGDGPLRGAVESWVAEAPGSRKFLGRQPRTEVLRTLAGSTVLVAPSLPAGRWREQVGRPIQEALSSGATVVTTEQTGVATALRSAGHHVLDHRTLATTLAPAIRDALIGPLPVAEVLGMLPAEDGRMLADAWLFAGDPAR
jgi:hypothetical protein